MTGAFDTMATVTCSTKRLPAYSGSKRGDPVANLTGLKCTPLDPLDAELRNLPVLTSPYEALQTFIRRDPDIQEGDRLVVGSAEYTIRAVEDWTWGNDVFLRLILEELK